MQVVTDTAVDISREQQVALNIHVVPQHFTMEGRTYRSGVDIGVAGFYDLLARTHNFPVTSPPDPEVFAETYRKLAQTDPDILSIHIASGLSDTLMAASEAAQQVPEANVKFIDTRTVSAAAGWQVVAAAHAVQRGWDLDFIQSMIEGVAAEVEMMMTVERLDYLIHGGRISHLRGLVAGLLNIKPILGVDKNVGEWDQWGRTHSSRRALERMVDLMLEQYEQGTVMRVQIVHGDVLDAADYLWQCLNDAFDCVFLPTIQVAPILACHTGPTAVGLAFGPMAAFRTVPGAES